MYTIKKNSPTVEAVATLVGTTIGAGILGIPYAISKAGFGSGLVLLIGLGAFNIILQLMFAEITLRTKQDHQIPGYGYVYLGIYAKRTALAVGMLAGYGTLLAYIIGEGQALHALFGLTSEFWSLLFFAYGAVIIYRGLKTIKKFEAFMMMMIFIVTIIIGLIASPHININNLFVSDFNNIFMPYGVILFALSGAITIPEIRKIIGHNETLFPKVVIRSNIIVIAIYTIFTLFVLGVTGLQTTEVATVGLGNVAGPIMMILGNALAFFAMLTSFLTVGLAMRRMFQYDYRMKKNKALLATLGLPLFLYLLGIHDFIKVLSIVGGVILGVQSSIIIFSFWRARIMGNRKPEFTLGTLTITGSLLLIIFLFGVIYTLLQSF